MSTKSANPKRNGGEEETQIAGIRFQDGGKAYDFSSHKDQDLIPGDYAVVETAWGRQIGQVIYVKEATKENQQNDLKPVLYRATGTDLIQRQQMEEKAQTALKKARELAARKSLPAKLAMAEYTLDGKRLTILYESETKEGLQSFQKELGRQLRTRVELQQIGPRDRAKLLDGYGACGEYCCCARFLTEFSSVSIRAAKAQGISLTPSEITGMCGRLRCCLVYEHEMYREASKNLPKRKARVRTEHGIGKVVGLVPLKEIVIVQLDDRRIQVPADQIQVLPKEQPKSKKQAKKA